MCRQENHPGFESYGEGHTKSKIGAISGPAKMDIGPAKYKKKVVVYSEIKRVYPCFRKYLLCPLQLPLHEIYYYNNSANIRYNLNATPRGIIQRGLATPHHYINVSSPPAVYSQCSND